VRELAARIEEGRSGRCLVPLQPEGSGPIFFIVHGVKGDVFGFRHLRNHVETEYRLYGIQCRGFDDSAAPLGSVEEMAAAYLEEVREIQPEGPYHLGGYSFGGLVAYEMARRLEREGQEVATLALLDTYCPMGLEPLPRSVWRWATGARVPSAPLDRSERWAYLMYCMRKLRYVASARTFAALRSSPLRGITIGSDNLPERVHYLCERAGKRYRPGRYGGPTNLFYCDLLPWAHPLVHEGWGKLVDGPLEVAPIPGGHYDLLMDPYIADFAGWLADRLGAAEPEA